MAKSSESSPTPAINPLSKEIFRHISAADVCGNRPSSSVGEKDADCEKGGFQTSFALLRRVLRAEAPRKETERHHSVQQCPVALRAPCQRLVTQWLTDMEKIQMTVKSSGLFFLYLVQQTAIA